MYLNIKDLRLAKHFTQERLAERLNISQGYLSRLERNEKVAVLGVRLKTIRDLARELGVKEKDILKFK
ncbi:helix-turn-helix domain-containing protein [Clostridium perfringens]|uniref:Helix-turn-helix domain protein n=1 Tax=Siphoviridae sp. ct16M3 TaxID=2825305 RepID=A0A8S5PR14_9CAUD|nr:helix-turn-helix transcriptional regulator [Clostridium perfringens]DAE08965.1 MAG TPA: helix-turn-helix domain protein [Siphoviridae sp. ct16M3]ELC8435050.1 helix-turn-helix transcriptional regulator [Clostridium perfringens]MBO3333443.1 helix-turn-helix transcriptional regulator [Clostridium perfringens]MDH5083544.1 helix-turn-helix protein [Clostridium perfringens]MDH5096453.1 helix-turn-helix protein [Clostridium perfringens]